MTSRVTNKFQTVVPKALRKQFAIRPGSTLDWQAEGDALRVVRLVTDANGGHDRKACSGKELADALRQFQRATTAADRRKMAVGVETARRQMNREHLH